jgi:hypothetical protein
VLLRLQSGGAPQLSSSVDLTLTLLMLARVVPAIGRSTSGGDGPVAVSQNPPLYPGNAGLKALLMLHLAEEMTCWPVSTRVGNVKSNDPSLIEPVVLSG